MEDQETPKVATIAISCQDGIANLLAAVIAEDCCVKDFLRDRDIQQMQERYAQWAGNLGALQHFKSPLSLDHRLRDAPLVRDSILNTLTDLHDSIQAVIDIASGSRRNRVTGPLTFDPDTDLSGYDISSSESDTSSAPGSDTGGNALAPTSEVQELISAIKTGLDSLFKASIFVRKFAPKDKRLRAAKTKSFDNRADVMYVNDRFPSLAHKNATLAARLGEANARRRQYFKYRRDHNERLSTVATENDVHKSYDIQRKQPGSVCRETEPAGSVLTIETKPSLLADTEATAFAANAAVQARMAEMYEAPAMSVASFATSIAETSDEELPYPPVPAEAQAGSPFLCAYCLTFVQLKREGSEQQWRKHILQDLEPYICTFSSCSLDSFQSQRAWFEHELLVHRCRWVCSLCLASFGSPEDLKGHISKHHCEVISDRQLSTIIGQSKRTIDSIQPNECPFCDGSWAKADSNLATDDVLVVNLDQFRRHLGNHLQQVALFALPRLTQDRDRSLGSNDVGGLPDRDAIPKAYLWVRDDCGHGWSIISRKRATFISFAFFLTLYQTGNKSTKLGSELDHLRGEQDQPDELTSISVLASTYTSQGQFKKAEELFAQVLEKRRDLLGPEHPSTLGTVNDLGRLYQNQGRFADAEAMYERPLAGKEKILGPEHPSMLDIVRNLGRLYRDQGRFVKALAMHRRALAGEYSTIGLRDLKMKVSRSVLEGHSNWVRAVAFSPDGQLLASASDDRTVKLWDPKTGASLGTLGGHSNRVNAVVFSPDGQLIASASEDHTVKLWDPKTGASRGTLEGHYGGVNAVVFSPDGQLIASASEDCTVRLWDSETGASLIALKGHSGCIWGVAFSPDGQLLASASDDHTVRLWDPKTGDSRGTLVGHLKDVNAVVFSPDGQLIASASGDRTVKLWAPKTGALLGILKGHSGWVRAVSFSPDGQFLASASNDRTVKLWDPKTGASLGTLEDHEGRVVGVAFSPDGQFIASASFDMTVKLWGLAEIGVMWERELQEMG